MDFIQYEENLHLLPPPPLPYPTPIPPYPFPFLSLPREIRDQIYHYALLRPPTIPNNPNTGIYPTHTVYIQNPPPNNNNNNNNPRVFTSLEQLHWGTRHSTPLFLVSRQFSHEALEVFYSTFPFHFPQWVDGALVTQTIEKTLTPWARNLITHIGFMFNIRCTPGPFTASDEEQRRKAVEAVVQLVPNPSKWEVSFGFVGREVPEWQVGGVVERAVGVVGALRGRRGVVVRGAEDQSAQRTRMLGEIREKLEGR